MSRPTISISFFILRRPSFFMDKKKVMAKNEDQAIIDKRPTIYQPKNLPLLGKP